MQAIQLNRFALVILCGVALVATGCGDKERNSSIEQMNLGIEAASKGAYQTAIKKFDEAVRLYPKNHYAHYQKGQVYAKQNKWEEAAESFGAAAKGKDDDPMYHMQYGISLYESGQVALAATQLERAIELNADLYRAHWYLGRVHRDEDRPKQAAESWTQAAALNPYDGRSFVNLGELYFSWDMVDEAIRVLEQGKAYVKDKRDLTNVYYYLGLAYEAKKDYDKAIEAYSKAIDLRSDNIDAKFQRGLAYAKKGDTSKAKADLTEYVNSGGGGTAFNKQEANKALMLLAASEGE